MSGHKQRAHSKFSASGAEKWLSCAASVALEEMSPPSQDSFFSKEGTEAHEVLEALFKMHRLKSFAHYISHARTTKDPMIMHAFKTVLWAYKTLEAHPEAELLIEARVHNEEIHPDMFGTVDVAIAEVFGTLHVYDFKYGQSVVYAEENKQMIQYALGLLEKYDWNFTGVVLHIGQPRASGSGLKSWAVSIEKMRTYRELWKKGVARVEAGKSKPFAGSWCHWCRARQVDPSTGTAVCPLKREAAEEKGTNMFLDKPIIEERTNKNGKEKSEKENGHITGHSEAEWKKAQSKKRKGGASRRMH